MTRRAIAWAVLGLMPVVSAAAQDGGAVRREDIKTWVVTVDGKEYEARPATPTYFGDTGLFHLSSAYTLPRGKVSFSLSRDNLDRDPKDVDVSIHGLSLGFGATTRLELFGSLALQNRVNVDARFQGGFVNDYPFAGTSASSPGWQTGLGDVRLGAKFKLLDDYQGDGVGLALRGFVKLGTADESKGLGTGKTDAGIALVLSKTLDRGADLHASIGYQKNGDPDRPKIGDALNWGVGINVPALRIVQIQAELTGSAYRGADFEQTKPLDLVVGPVLFIKPGLFLRPAISWNLNFDDRGLASSRKSSTGRQISIGYHPGTLARSIEAPPPPPPPPPPPANRAPTVTCEAERATVAPGDTVGLRAIASDPDGDSLSYSWTSSAGRITGTGASVRLDTSGVTPPAGITATVRVSDGRGASAEAGCPLRIPAPERKPEAMTCESGGFPANLARLNNVDKACLDDVASRLRQDPRSRVVVVGHADRAERRPDVIARQRAETVKTYLVRERGVDESRVSVRSVGATRPREAGSSRTNRRVEVIFVPEGATVPEDD